MNIGAYRKSCKYILNPLYSIDSKKEENHIKEEMLYTLCRDIITTKYKTEIKRLQNDDKEISLSLDVYVFTEDELSSLFNYIKQQYQMGMPYINPDVGLRND